MQLLVSVSDAVEAAAALEGGADIIDAKDPLTGALGAVTLPAFGRIHAAVAGARPVSAALGDAANEAAVETLARAFAMAGAAFVKVGFAGVSSRARGAALLAAAIRGTTDCETPGRQTRVVACAYADAERIASLHADEIAGIATDTRAAGVLLDTADKTGPGLLDLTTAAVLTAFVDRAHRAGLFVALAGRLRGEDLPVVRGTGADLIGVRGAACDGGRTGRVSVERVLQLQGQSATL